MKIAFLGILASLALPPSAMAATVTAQVIATGAESWQQVVVADSVARPSGATWTTAPVTLPNDDYGIDKAKPGSWAAPGAKFDPCQFACSPFYGGVYEKDIKDGADSGAPGWQTTEFFTVFQPTTGYSEAILDTIRPRTSLTFLWGSPDLTNVVHFLLGKVWVASFSGEDLKALETKTTLLIPSDGPGRGSVLLSFSGIVFDKVRFGAKAMGGSMELSNVSLSPVPLPSAGLALFGGMALLGWSARRRRVA